ncbi:carbamoyl-phosphate synthase L chain ATP binding domain-containing protein [Penicillium malachiteum]|uniref:carbamoyl-phosphate synthase L chain ATP binding domain-containing protein n=1 Tax=Penicillium malachiteum TaxID=1324776 RepID=UPI002548922A|nr:carbamoyl-phosphate synthase L chain ATP binding domain-containing protein [Penicillium malachiteum]KAJ5726300.1 carbamoyl-phosphate synthase L chain ATP binding domain-containing protein [Penicillium malachiteum]
MQKVLIANRGEIAVRIIRACQDYGVLSVVAYSDLDVNALFVQLADEAYALNGSNATETYLDIKKLIAIAKRVGADAVHPGYGFLSERAGFAQAVVDAGLTWIGPDPSVIEVLGDKVEARRIAVQVGAPLIAGSDGPVSTATEVLAFVKQNGLPIAIKAVHGGGGRGMKVAWAMEDVVDAYESSVREATAAFGRGECFVERYLHRPRHVEAQVLADKHGQVLVLGTRDCSVQRRHQKLIEEAPAPFLSKVQEQNICDAAKKICAAVGYSSAGTVEFLLGADGSISFLEVNTRLQVEHPVTEETTGIDIVLEQFRIAEVLPLSITETPVSRGHSIEFRINAEDPGHGFLPTPGAITKFEPPSGPGIRLDSGVIAGSAVPAAYDSLMAKLIVSGATREQALARARRALREFRITGVSTVIPFHRAVLDTDDFISKGGFRVHTRWVETDFTALPLPALRPDPVNSKLPVERIGRPCRWVCSPAKSDPEPSPSEGDHILAPISGTLQAYKVANGTCVSEGDLVGVMEAMKMETQILAPKAGRILLVAKEGEYVQAGDVLLAFEYAGHGRC